MADKMFELMTKMYSEMTSKFDIMDKRFKGIDKRFESIDKRFDCMDNKIDSLKNDVIRIENKFDNESKILFDGYKHTYEEVKEIRSIVDNLSVRMEKQEVEIRVIKGGKQF